MERRKSSLSDRDNKERKRSRAPSSTGTKMSGSNQKNFDEMIDSKYLDMTATVDLEQCKYCKRKFATNRLEKHMAICKNLQVIPKRKVFDSQKQRLRGTDAEPFAKYIKPVQRPVSNWKKNHEDLIEAIRAARRAHAHIARGGNPADHPPPPPTDYSDYIQCPHCGRPFNEIAAAKHIPACENMIHNK